MLTLTWVPSKKAVTAGIVPKDYSQYDINVLDYLSPELVALLKKEAPAIMDSVRVAATKIVRHAYNNESASGWIGAKTATENPVEDTTENRAAFLHNWRTKWRAQFIEGKFGMRSVTVTIPEDRFTVIMKGLAFNFMRGFAESKGTPFPYDEPDAATLAMPYGKRTVGEVLKDLIDPEKAPKRYAEFKEIADAQMAREAADKERAAASATDEDDEMAGLMGGDESDEPEGEPEGEAA